MAEWPRPSRWVSNLWALVTGANHGVHQDRAVGNAHVLKEIIDLASECDVPADDRRRWATDGFEAIIGDFLENQSPAAPDSSKARPNEPPGLPPAKPRPELPPGQVGPTG